LVQAFNVNTNTGEATFTAKLQIIGAGEGR
jgi:hypothetical protein